MADIRSIRALVPCTPRDVKLVRLSSDDPSAKSADMAGVIKLVYQEMSFVSSDLRVRDVRKGARGVKDSSALPHFSPSRWRQVRLVRPCKGTKATGS